jgi:hypothetical protein
VRKGFESSEEKRNWGISQRPKRPQASVEAEKIE